MAHNNVVNTKSNIGGPSGGICFKYLGFSQTKNVDNITTTTVTYQATQAQLEAQIGTSPWTIGTVDNEWGRLDNIELKPESGPFWNAILTYVNPPDSGIRISIGSTNSPTQRSLNVIMKSLALQTRENYKYIWNHVLIYLDTDNYTCPDYAQVSGLTNSDYKSIINSSSGHLKWVRDASEMPTDPVYQDQTTSTVNGNQTVSTPHYWKIAYECSKPGVQYYEVPAYEITEQGRYRSLNGITWWRQNAPGKIVTLTTTQTFGITDGEWLCLGGTVHYDGKTYEANCTYQWSPTQWDRDLYDEVTTSNGGNLLPGGN